MELIVTHLLFFFFLRNKKGDSHVAVIVPCPTVYLGKPMNTTSLNQSLEISNSYTLQTLLVSRTYQKLQLQFSRELELDFWDFFFFLKVLYCFQPNKTCDM